MNQKQRQRLGSAIVSTMLSFTALSLAAVDKAQAAVLTYNFNVSGEGSGFFKFSNSSLTGIGSEQIAVSEGRLRGFTAPYVSSVNLSGKPYNDLTGAIALFDQGEFRGLRARGGDSATTEVNTRYPGEPGGPYYIKYSSTASWSMDSNWLSGSDIWRSYFSGYKQIIISDKDRVLAISDRRFINGANVSYTLVDTAAEPVPEPITMAGTALALAGLSWLKHQKKVAA